MRLIAEDIDPSTMKAIRDITDLIAYDDSSYVLTSTSAELVTSGEISFVGDSQWSIPIVRLFRQADDEAKICLGTFFATPKEIAGGGGLITGKIQLDGMLLALSSTRLSSTYIAASGATASQVISDMCRISGRPTNLSPEVGDHRYAAPVFYEAGSTCLSVAQEAAERSGVVLGSDTMGFITIESTTPNQGLLQTWTTSPSQTDIVSEVSKSLSWVTSPTRIIATYNDSDVTIAASASIGPSSRDATTSGRHIDETISLSDMTSPSIATLKAAAEKALKAQYGQDEWSFQTLWRDDMFAGVPARIYDPEHSQVMDGVVTQVRTSLTDLMTQEVTVRGTVR